MTRLGAAERRNWNEFCYSWPGNSSLRGTDSLNPKNVFASMLCKPNPFESQQRIDIAQIRAKMTVKSNSESLLAHSVVKNNFLLGCFSMLFVSVWLRGCDRLCPSYIQNCSFVAAPKGQHGRRLKISGLFRIVRSWCAVFIWLFTFLSSFSSFSSLLSLSLSLLLSLSLSLSLWLLLLLLLLLWSCSCLHF